MTSISSARVNVNTDEFVLEAIITFGFFCLSFGLTSLLNFLFSHVFLINLLRVLVFIFLFLETTLLAHDFMERIGLQIEDVGERAERVDFIVLESVEVKANTL